MKEEWLVTDHKTGDTVEKFEINKIVGKFFWLSYSFGPIDWNRHYYKKLFWRIYVRLPFCK